MQNVTSELYLTLAEAGRLLGGRRAPLSQRRVMNFVSDAEVFTEGRIRRVKQTDPRTKRAASMLLASDVAALVKLRAARARLLRSPAALAAAPPAQLPAPVEASPPAQLAAAQVSAPAAEWLTIDQAAARTGLPPDSILEWVVAGDLAALDVGARKGAHWRYRVHRDDLAALRTVAARQAEERSGTRRMTVLMQALSPAVETQLVPNSTTGLSY